MTQQHRFARIRTAVTLCVALLGAVGFLLFSDGTASTWTDLQVEFAALERIAS